MVQDLIARIRLRAESVRTRTDTADISLPPLFPRVTISELAQAESRLGFPLPAFLRQVYQDVGNGGFGPGYGLIGLPGGFHHDEGKSIIELYQSYRASSQDDPNWKWPEKLVPVCDWGCAIFSCVDCNSGAVITFDPSPLEPGVSISFAFAQSHPSIEAWFEDWTNDVRLWDLMFEPDSGGERVLKNPKTGRAAVITRRRLRR